MLPVTDILNTLNGLIMENEDETYTINYAKVVSEKDLLAVTRLLAATLINTPYTTIGDFLRDLSDNDLEQLVEVIDGGEEHNNFEDLMLIAGMLSCGEGLPCGTVEDYQRCMNMLMTYVVCESLYRKGLIKIHRENMSFGDDMANACVAERLEDND